MFLREVAFKNKGTITQCFNLSKTMYLRFSIITLFLFSLSFGVAQKLDLAKLENLNIRNVGPANMSGRITTIDAVTANPKIIYVGAASGGVWKSENGGSAWKPVFDDQPTQNIGALKVQQSNPSVIWVGTGEGNPRNSMNLGAGIFKSIDAGKTWKLMGLESTKVIHRIVIDPRNPDIVYVGAMGDPFTPNQDRGLYKTIDGGKTWSKILFTNNQSGIADLVMDPTNPNKLFAAVYEHRRTPYYFTSGGKGSGLYVSYDAGETWTKQGEKEGLPAGELGRIGLAIAPSDVNRIYAKVEAEKNVLLRSDNGGDSWYVINDNPRFTNNRPFYFQELAVDTKDPNRLYNIYQPLSVSYDGGKTFDPTPMIPADETKGVHADFHAFWVNPHDPHNFIIGGDGGLGITNDHGKSWYFPETIPVAQFYHINVDNDRPYNVYGGMQDNGNWSGPGYTWKRGGIRTLYWQYLVGGDGFYISPDPDNSRFGFGTSQNGDLYRYDKLTGYYQSIKPHAPNMETTLRFNWNAAFARDPFDLNTIYYGSQFIHKSVDKGATWEIISPDLSTNNPEHQKGDYGGLTLDISGAEMYNSILSIAPSSLDKNIIWSGTDDGRVHLTRDGGTTWVDLTKQIKNLPQEAWIARIKASKHNAGTAWVVVNDYRRGDYAPYLFKTDDFGKSWVRLADETKVKGYALSFIQDPVEPNLVFLGTENGLWISIDRGQTWEQFKNGFPSVSTMDLVIQERESALIVGTFGRAIWVLDDLLSLREIASGRVQSLLTALPMNDAVQVKGLFIAPPGNIWTGFHTTWEGENRVFQKTEIPFFIKENPQAGAKVEAEIYNADNKLINKVNSEDLKSGLNYVIWKLDEMSSTLPGAWVNEESRGIPVLPGDYKIILDYNGEKSSTTVKVIEDPRFDIDSEVDKKLYEFKKAVDSQVARLSDLLTEIDSKENIAKKIDDQLKDLGYSEDYELRVAVTNIFSSLKDLKAKGRIPRPDRQVGAWQSFEVSAYSKVGEALLASAARMVVPSSQDLRLMEDSKVLIDRFKSEIDEFKINDWKKFESKIKDSRLNWFDSQK